MEAQVPQPISASSTRFGALTLSQLGWCALAAAAPFLLLVRCHLPLATGTGLSLPSTLAGLVAAFARPEGRPAAAWAADWARFHREPRELEHPAAHATRDERGWRPLDSGNDVDRDSAARCA